MSATLTVVLNLFYLVVFLLILLDSRRYKLAILTCPKCGKETNPMDHGYCPKCKSYCGCSFNPVSENDHCGYHWMQLNQKEDKAKPCVACGFAHKRSERCGPW